MNTSRKKGAKTIHIESGSLNFVPNKKSAVCILASVHGLNLV